MKGPFEKNVITHKCSCIFCTFFLTEALSTFMNFCILAGEFCILADDFCKYSGVYKSKPGIYFFNTSRK